LFVVKFIDVLSFVDIVIVRFVDLFRDLRFTLLAFLLADEPHREFDSSTEKALSARTEDDVGIGESETVTFVSFTEDLFGEEELEESFAITSVDV